MQHRLYRGRQLIVAEAVPSLQPDEHCEGMLPHPSISGIE
jgi:hypothetical protein